MLLGQPKGMTVRRLVDEHRGPSSQSVSQLDRHAVGEKFRRNLAASTVRNRSSEPAAELSEVQRSMRCPK